MNQKIVSQDFSSNFFSKRKKEKEKLDFGINSTYLLLLSVITGLLLYYVWLLNINATQGYITKQLDFEKQNLMMEKERLDVKIAELQSLGNIMTDEDLKNMEEVEKPDFLVVKENVQYVYTSK